MTTANLQNLLFNGVGGYSLSSVGKSRIGREGDAALTYGEVTPEAVEHILSLVDPKPGETFYDLGSGTGKMVVLAAFIHPFSKSVGIELLEELHDCAQSIGKRYEREVQSRFSDGRASTELHYRLGDIFEADLSDADIVVSHCCTCFDDSLMQKLSDRLETLKPGARIVTVSRSLNSSAFTPIGTSSCQMGWGTATLNVYLKN